MEVQTIHFKFNIPGEGKNQVSFIGKAVCSRQTWKKIEEQGTSFWDLLEKTPDAIQFVEPMPIEKFLSDNPNLNNLVDIIREEAQRHHDELTDYKE